MVFQEQHDAPTLGVGDAGGDGIGTPLETVVMGVALPGIDPAFGLDQLVEAAAFAPAARVDANRRATQLMGQVDAVERVVDVLLTLLRLGPYKVLMDAQVVDVEAQTKGMAFELLQIGRRIRLHLTMEDLYAVQPQFRRFIHDSFDGHPLRQKMPIGIS